MKYLLDTNICIFLIRQKHPHLLRKFSALSVESMGISTISVAELELGVHKSQRAGQNQAALNEFLLPITLVDFDYLAAKEYGRIRAWLEQKGTPIGSLDLLIASQALSRGLLLVTNNTKEFHRVPGLTVMDWMKL